MTTCSLALEVQHVRRHLDCDLDSSGGRRRRRRGIRGGGRRRGLRTAPGGEREQEQQRSAGGEPARGRHGQAFRGGPITKASIGLARRGVNARSGPRRGQPGPAAVGSCTSRPSERPLVGAVAGSVGDPEEAAPEGCAVQGDVHAVDARFRGHRYLPVGEHHLAALEIRLLRLAFGKLPVFAVEEP